MKTISLPLPAATSAVAQSDNLSGVWKQSLTDNPDQAQPQNQPQHVANGDASSPDTAP